MNKKINLEDKIERLKHMIELENYVDGGIALTFEFSKLLHEWRFCL